MRPPVYRPSAAEEAELQRLLADVEPKQRVEHHERVWWLWDHEAVLGLLVLLLTVEWVGRKLVGRV